MTERSRASTTRDKQAALNPPVPAPPASLTPVERAEILEERDSLVQYLLSGPDLVSADRWLEAKARVLPEIERLNMMLA